MTKFTASVVLVLLVVAILNGYSAEGAGRGNQLEKDDHVYESQKVFSPPPMPGCSLWHNICLFFPDDCPPGYHQHCPPQPNKDLQSTTAKSGNPNIEILP
jgi:hypothetical protein